MNWDLQLFLLFLWGLGIAVSLKKPLHPEQDTIFNNQNWNIWIGVAAATIYKTIIFFRLGVRWFSDDISNMLVAFLLIEVSFLIGILLFYHLLTKQRYAVLGFYLDHLGTRIVYGSRWMVGYFWVKNGFNYFLYSLVSEERLRRLTITKDNGGIIARLFESTWGTWSLWIPFFSEVILGPVIEEIVFRGFLYGPNRKKIGPAIAIIATSIIFALMHESGYVNHFVSGLLYAYLYERTQSLLPSILFHGLENYVSVVHNYSQIIPVWLVDTRSKSGWMMVVLVVLFAMLEGIYRWMLKKGYALNAPVSILKH